MVSWILPVLVNNKAIIVNYEGNYYFPALHDFSFIKNKTYLGSDFGQDKPGQADYKKLKVSWLKSNSKNWLILPIYTHDPYSDINSGNKMYEPPMSQGGHIFGTDDTGRDVFARMLYAFNISISFALLLTVINYIIGVSIGGSMGYFGGKFDLFFQRLIEIWSTLPLLFVIIIIASIITPNFFILIGIYILVNWIGMTYMMRAEFYREKSKDYVAAAISMGQSNITVIFKHILPNSLVPIITYFPFSIIAGIGSLVGLDYLGFGMPPPTPSWGQMMDVGLQNISKWWMVFAPISAQFMTLLLIVFIGEGIREAFDPKVHSRIR